jgi:hypothetical protein
MSDLNRYIIMVHDKNNPKRKFTITYNNTTEKVGQITNAMQTKFYTVDEFEEVTGLKYVAIMTALIDHRTEIESIYSNMYKRSSDAIMRDAAAAASNRDGPPGSYYYGD